MGSVADCRQAGLGPTSDFGMASERLVTARPDSGDVCVHRGAQKEVVARSDRWGPTGLEDKRLQRLPVWSNYVALDRPPSVSR
jgi:hypothetical protein